MKSAQKSVKKQPVQSRSQATIDAVTEATVQVLRRSGAEGLTTTRVAERAGVSVGSLYQYFPNKRALIEAVRAQYFAVLSDAVGYALIARQSHGTEEQLHAAIDALLITKQENLALSEALANAPHDGSEADFATEVVNHFADALLAAFSEAVGEVDADRTRATVAALEGMLTYAVRNEPNWLSQDWFADRLKAIARDGLINH